MRLELIEEAIQMGYHHAVEPESFRNQAAAWTRCWAPALQQVFEEGAPVSTLREVARQVEQTQVRR